MENVKTILAEKLGLLEIDLQINVNHLIGDMVYAIKFNEG